MRTVQLGETEISVQGGPWALVLYEREFSPEHPDFFDDAHKYSPNEALGRFSADPMFLLRCCWAMARNANDAFPTFEMWAKSLDIPIYEGAPWTNEVISALNAEIFRSSESSEGGKE